MSVPTARAASLCAPLVGADGDQHLHVALIELAGQQLGGMRGICGRILEAARRQAVRRRYAEHRRAGHDKQRDGDDPPRRTNGQPSDTL